MGSLLYLLLCSGYIAQLVSAEEFLVTAPSIIHVGVKEKVSVQVGEGLLNVPVTCYLEQEVGRVLVSKREPIWITEKGKIETLELEISTDKIAGLISVNGEPPYLNLVCDVGEIKRKTRVLVSQHRGYIFIQTDQPMYNPTQKVRYRIFTLDHAMRPISEMIHVNLNNAEGNTIKKMLVRSKSGIYSNYFYIPDVSQPGVWKIKAYYRGDEKSATIQEFKVQKFVLPSFGVTIKPETDHLLMSAENFKFSIDVSYSYGKKISGGFHCRFGVRKENTDGPDEITFIKGLEKTGPVRNGEAEITLKISDILEKLAKLKLEAQNGIRFYIAVTVTDTISGEVQESEILLPMVSQRYKVDLDRTRSYYIPKMPFEVKVVVRTPNGLPAKDVPVKMSVSHTKDKSITANTDNEGVAFSVFNLDESPRSISVEATVDGFKSTKDIRIATSSSSDFLHISASNKVLAPGNQLSVKFDVVSGQPNDGYIYYLVLSKGTLRKSSSVAIGNVATIQLNISPDMIPSFRLIGYYYNTHGEIIADSIWIDVKDVCEGKVVVTEKEQHVKNYYDPAQIINLNIDVGDQQDARVALLAVDKAIYSLNAQNKLTPKQVFSSMQSYDLGCSYGGGENTAAVFNDAGLTFLSHSSTVKSQMRIGFGCESGFRRQRRSIDVQKELAQKETEYTNAVLKKCCRHGLTLLPMKLSCEERNKRINASKECEEVFLKCCNFATQLREKKRQEGLKSSYGRTSSASDIENFFDNEVQYIRHSFPPSFQFEDIHVNGQTTKPIILPDSITTWEIQAVSVSRSHGFCVAEPLEIRAFQQLFISLRLPYSVRKNEQMAIVVVIYNYGKHEKELAVHMKQIDGLCSPGASSTDSYVNISLAKGSSETVTFSAVPLKEGEFPITIQLYDREYELGVDAIQKTLLVMNEGVRVKQEESKLINLDGRSEMYIDGRLPNGTIPGLGGNVFVKVEDEIFGTAAATPLLTPSSVKKLINAPHGCAEQTMIRMSPTALAIRYLDSHNRWLELEAEMRDNALGYIEEAYDRILTFKKPDGSYGAWTTYPTSNWLTALVVKVLSLVSECELSTTDGRQIVSQLEIRNSVKFLIEQQNKDGSFADPNPVIHREMQGGIGGVEQDASLTAFIAIALKRSLPFLDEETDSVNSSISQATGYLSSRVDELQRPFSLAITTYCLSTCLEDKNVALSAWKRLKSLAIKAGDCKVWKDNEDMRLLDEKKQYLVPSVVALTVETTAYALLTAIELKDFEEAKLAACFLTSQENYEGGFKSTQDTIIALEALSEYATRLPPVPLNTISVQFTSRNRNEKESLVLNKKGEKVETDLKRLLGNDIIAEFSGNGQAKVKVVKAYYVPDTSSDCSQLSIDVTVKGKVEYTTQVTENYDYDYSYDDPNGRREEEDFPQSAIEWFDARTRRRRDTQQSQNADDIVKYEVCISHSLKLKLTGMAIADITLLSGFEPKTEDLDLLKDAETQYISHYEFENGRVLLYFNKIYNGHECIAFEAVQKVPIGLLQPAPATIYDYYEPERRCTVFYAAPGRSKRVSALCSNEVCQCAERACFKEKQQSSIQEEDRFRHACYQPVADYGFIVTVKSVEDKKTFDFYNTHVTTVLKFNGDVSVDEGKTRFFAKRKHCKSQLKQGETYLIMGKDGSTTDLNGQMLYLLDSHTWVEQKPTKEKCEATTMKLYCKKFKEFLRKYQLEGCSQ
ncbi:complement C4-B [Ictalurus punctatus]|uniref:Complement C4-B n=1 Tax=Ictalurus punctatus TaxID=7998 RepID=A0A2D0R9F2_ICTPU|nr:complement C4-B [Ictalurus punctatus]